MLNSINKLLNATVALGVSMVLGLFAFSTFANVDLTALVRDYPAEVYGGSIIAFLIFAVLMGKGS